jgi:hypothetical protein
VGISVNLGAVWESYRAFLELLISENHPIRYDRQGYQGSQQEHHKLFKIALTDIQKTRVQQAIFQEEVIYEAG